MMETKVQYSSKLTKDLKKNNIPLEIVKKAERWETYVKKNGLSGVRKINSYNDHKLKGDRVGQNSAYLNDQWRLIYTENISGEVELVTIEEITPHKY